MSVCSVGGVGLLFLPAAYSETGYWSVGSSTDSRLFIAWEVNVRSNSLSRNFGIWRRARLCVRLASRSGLSGCSVGVVSLLFLPAAGQMIDGKSQVLNQWVRVWTNLASEASGMQLRSVLISCKGSNIPGALTGGREEGRSIRLASRSELFGCSDVVGVCLLFLPAYGDYYSSVSSSTDSRVWIRWVQRMSSGGTFGLHRYRVCSVRLASR